MAHLFHSLAFGIALACAGCAAPALTGRVDTSPARVAGLEARLAADSTDTEALRHLGIVYVHLDRFDAALPLLRRAFAQNAQDRYALVYYGLALEHTGRLDAALPLYARYRALPRGSRLRTLLAGRYAAASRALAERDLRARLAAEDSLTALPLEAEAPPNTVAVFPLQFQAGDSLYAPLGRGLSALIVRDLATVERLTVLERLRLDVLLDELRLAGGEAVAPGTAPRVGRLLRARRLVVGGYAVSPEARVRLDVALHETTGAAPHDFPAEDRLRRFYALQKDVVFRLLDAMAVPLTAAERDRIDQVPTRDLQALLAFSRGLEEEDAGRYGAAAAHFREAVRRDPGFEAAHDHLALNEGLLMAGRGLDAVLAAVAAPLGADDDALLRARHLHLGGNIGSLVVPGPDARDPAVEFAGPGDVIERPPDPPEGGN